ncbi:MAG: hypothetical protein M3R04_05425 [bacterium]|nr:hypothetical protein [bacterium]
MKTLSIAIAAALAALLLGSCGSSNVGPTTGSVSGSLEVAGPFNGAAELNVGLFPDGSDVPVQTAVAGRVTSVASATLSGRAIAFSFTDVTFGIYSVRLYSSGPGGNTFHFRSADITLSELNPTVSNFDEQASFTGEGPFGSVSGIALLSDDFEFPAAGELAFIGISPVSDPQNALQWIVDSADASSGQLAFNIDGIAYGTWLVGLYGYNPGTHAVTVFGLLDAPLTVSAATPNITGAVFGADSGGDPGVDPALASISGTVTFNGGLPAGQYIAVAANTIPPQQGAPPSTFDVLASAVDGNTVAFTLPLLPDGTYSVSIFSYDFATHTATYFGEYDGTVVIAAAASVADIDFNADVTVIGGSAD